MLSFSQQSRNYHHFAKGDDNDNDDDDVDGKGVGKCGKRGWGISGKIAGRFFSGNMDKVCTLLARTNGLHVDV